jgi:hypothetical protein
VESVDPLSTDEACESIVVDMPDHNRRRSRAHFLLRVLMNIRRRARGVRGRVKPSMIIYAELQKLLKTWLIKY